MHLGFELIFFSRVNELFNSIEIEIVIVSNKRTVPGMGLGSCLHLPFWGSAIELFLTTLVTIINYMSSCKFYHDCILAPIKRKKKTKQKQKQKKRK